MSALRPFSPCVDMRPTGMTAASCPHLRVKVRYYPFKRPLQEILSNEYEQTNKEQSGHEEAH